MSFLEFLTLLRADLLRLTLPKDGNIPVKPNWIKILNPRFTPVLLIRLARYLYLSKWLHIFSPVFTWLNVFIFGIEFTARCDVGPGLFLPHTVGTVIGARKIGANVTIYHGVTIGAKYADLIFDESKRPVIEDGVAIATGAKVLGDVVVGQRVKIGPNSVVLESIPAGVIVVAGQIQQSDISVS